MATTTRIPLLLLAAITGCSGDGMSVPEDPCPDADAYVAGLTKMGDDTMFQVSLMDALPAPPGKGDNIWTVNVNRAGGGAVEGATIEVEPFMPLHGHGTPRIARITESEDEPGRYTLDPVNLFMGGLWEVHVNVTVGDETDHILFNMCIPD